MCGIAGFFRAERSPEPFVSIDNRKAILDSIRHRGPDAEGDWESADGRCWLGFRRLAIIDLITGDQPMSNEDGTVHLVFNGEIYNFVQLTDELKNAGHVFKSHADSEVLVHGYEEWGIEGLLQRLRGIFAFAIHDARKNRIYLARDQMGVKPLFYRVKGRTLVFSSEIKAILRFPGFDDRSVEKAGLAQFLTCRYVSRPYTMFEGVRKLNEACWISFGLGDDEIGEPKKYWKPSFAVADNPPSFDDALERLDALLRETVRMQLMADVPVGAQLSGGVDSSLVVAYMQMAREARGESDPIHTYSVGFDEPGFSELKYANMVAKRYGTLHNEITVTWADYLRELPQLAWIYDEPIGEPPAVPTYLMCKAAKSDVTVMLCGEGADEQFGGYGKYAFDTYSKYIDWMPSIMRRVLLKTSGTLMPFRARRLRAILEILALHDPAKRYTSWYGAFDSWSQFAILDKDLRAMVGEEFLKRSIQPIIAECDSKSALKRFQYCDIQTRLVDDLLVKGDRMSMGASVEARVPLMDHHVVEFAAALPASYHVKGIETKRLLKKLAERYVPHEAIYRRKVGFTVPLTRWFVGPWASFVCDVLVSDRTLSRGYFRPDIVKKVVQDHLNRKVDREQGLWVLLAIEIWHRIFIDDDGSEEAAARCYDELNIDSRVEAVGGKIV